MNGDRTWVSARKQESDEILKWLHLKTLQNGDTTSMRYRKHWQTEMPSIQGAWTPWTQRNPELNLAQFPNIVWGEMLNKPQTATERLLEIVQESPQERIQVSSVNKESETIEKS